VKTSALQNTIEDYLTAKRNHGSPATADQYRYSLEGVFLPWCKQEDITEPVGVTDKALDRFTAHLKTRTHKQTGKPISEQTARTYLRAVRIFLKWADVPKGKFKAPKAPGRKLLDVLSDQEIAAMEKAASDERDRLVVRVLADTGIRISELLGLRTRDLRENTHDRRYAIRVTGKGDKERDVPVNPTTFRRLERYAEQGKGQTYIFCGKRRRPNGEFEQLTRSGADQLIRNLAKRARIGRRVYPHLFRHSYATAKLSNGMNPIVLQTILGHESLAMISQTYQHLVIADTYDAMMRTLVPTRKAG
jgi:integrase/recombinase XerD